MKSGLKRNITLTEIDCAIKKLQSGKVPGRDQCPLLAKVFEEVLRKRLFPQL